MVGKICLVTGATSGIGLVTARELARMGATVVLMARSRERGEATRAAIAAQTGNQRVELILADFASLASVRAGAAAMGERYGHLDVLVNNAGIIAGERRLSADGYELTFAVNHLAPFLLTALLGEALRAAGTARVVTVSSRAHMLGRGRFEDGRAPGRYNAMQAYGESKLANVLFTYELARRLDGSGVSANCLHPGAVRTGFGAGERGFFAAALRLAAPLMLSPEQGAQTSIFLTASPEVEGVTGKYFVKRRAQTSSPTSYDRGLQASLWSLSEELTGSAAPVAV